MHTFLTNYQQRPFFFGFFSPYEFSRKTNKINYIRSHWFHQDHPQYKTHNIYGYKIPKISKIPIFQIYTIPWEKKIQKIMLKQFLLFFLHGELCSILKMNSLGCHGKQHWMNHFQNFPNSTKQIIKKPTFYMNANNHEMYTNYLELQLKMSFI